MLLIGNDRYQNACTLHKAVAGAFGVTLVAIFFRCSAGVAKLTRPSRYIFIVILFSIFYLLSIKKKENVLSF
ncbi:MAG: hypothetical protein HQL56_13255 [Magnetococcales bacterium]|nr:hypothetical protein [Magnetococcales bacterium]